MADTLGTTKPGHFGDAIGPVLLTHAQLKELGIEVSNTTLLRWEYSKRFPRRLKLAGTRVVWLRTEVMQWIVDRAEERGHTHYADPFG